MEFSGTPDGTFSDTNMTENEQGLESERVGLEAPLVPQNTEKTRVMFQWDLMLLPHVQEGLNPGSKRTWKI